MSEISFFFNSVGGDRTYNAESIGMFLAPFFSGGVFANPSSTLQATADGSGMKVTIQPGFGFVKTSDNRCYLYRLTAALDLMIPTADGSNSRIDRIVIRQDTAGRTVTAQVKQGTYATSPAAPAVQQDADYWELALADVAVPAGTTAISQSAVTDQRLNTAVCGVVAATITQPDTTTLFNQYQAWLSEQIAAHAVDNTNWQAQMTADRAANQNLFNIWLNDIKNSMTGDPAADYTVHKAKFEAHMYYGGTASTSNNADYAVTIQDPVPTGYYDGFLVHTKLAAACTGNMTLNVNGLGAKSCYDVYGNRITSMPANVPCIFCYESGSGNFISLAKGGAGTATADKLLLNATATSQHGYLVGTMPENGAVTITPGPNDIALNGHYTGKVSGVVVPANKVLNDTTIAGTTGTMPNNGALNYSPSTAAQNIPAGYTSGGSITAVPGNAAAAQILSGYSASSANGINMAGTANAGYTATGSGTSSSSNVATVTGLSFRPSIVLIWVDSWNCYIVITDVVLFGSDNFMSVVGTTGTLTHNTGLITDTGFSTSIGYANAAFHYKAWRV